MKRRKAFTLIELLVVVAIIALLISILLPSLARARELAKRAVCAANMKGLGNSYHIYANVNYDMFPIAPHNETTSVSYVGWIGERGSTRKVTAVGQVPDYTSSDTNVSNTAHPWLLVRDGDVGPDSFYCPSSIDAKDRTDSVGFYHDFTGWNTVSYGFQVPFTFLTPALSGASTRNLATPINTMDSRVAIAADKGPYSDAGSALGTNNAGQGGIKDKYMAVNSPNGWPGFQGRPTDYRPFNSPNHGGRGDGEGQNILYPDGHAEFSRRPDVGMNADNIYTQTLIPFPPGSEGQVLQAGNLTPLTATDSVIWP